VANFRFQFIAMVNLLCEEFAEIESDIIDGSLVLYYVSFVVHCGYCFWFFVLIALCSNFFLLRL